jgi:aminocarboxymuconate-semialdehyde decarboxylase
MIIDVHGHLVPPDLLAAIRKEHGGFPSLRLIEDGGSLAIAFAGGKPSRPIMKGLSDVAGRLAWMDKQAIDRHVVGGWPDWFGYELPAAEGEAWCRLFNDAQLAAANAERRFVPLASVPLQDGARAGAVLKAAVAAGFPGAMISTLPRGIGSVLDAADLDPFWAAADESGAIIHIHPSYDAGDSRVNNYGLANAAVASVMPSSQWRGSSRAATSRATAMPRFSCPWVLPGFPSSLVASSATTRSRRGLPIRRKGWRYSIPTASCMTRGCCDLSWR